MCIGASMIASPDQKVEQLDEELLSEHNKRLLGPETKKYFQTKYDYRIKSKNY